MISRGRRTSYDRETRVVRGSGASTGLSWTSLQVWPPLIDGVGLRILATANSAAAEADPPLVASAWRRYWLDGSIPGEWVETTPPALAIPDVETMYVSDVPPHHERELSGSVRVTYEVRLEMRTGTGEIVDAIAQEASWWVDVRPPAEPPPPE